LPIKEVLEGFEFVAKARKAVRTHTVADLCCGHGLVGMLMGIFEKKVQKVILVDKSEPPSHRALFDAVADVCPWIRDKVVFQARKLALVELPKGTSVVSAHACGKLTDDCMDIAIDATANLAVMPCCYPRRNCNAPNAVLNQFGEAYAFDIDRTYRLENAGYKVKWSHIPDSITPMNRILIGKRPN